MSIGDCRRCRLGGRDSFERWVGGTGMGIGKGMGIGGGKW